MSKFKKVLALLLVVALTAALSVSLTMAYLQDTDEQVNVMTLGNVKIKQHEYERVLKDDGTYETITTASGTGYKLQPFTQAKPLYPAVGTVTDWDTNVVNLDQIGGEGNMQVLDGINNVQDKFVVVENTGKSDAYVRTFIAYECGDVASADAWNELVMTSNHVFWDTPVFYGVPVEIQGNKYIIGEYVYNQVLKAGAVSRNSLSQVYLRSNATNEDVEALDGNNNGTYDILVLSQAVQVKGFETAGATSALNTAFGEANTANVQAWFGSMEVPVLVSTADELQAALNAGQSVVLTEDIDMGGYKVNIIENDNAVIDLNGHTLTSKDGGASKGNMAVLVNRGATLTLKDSAGGGKIVASCYGIYVQPNATFIMDGGTIEVSGNGKYDIGVTVWNGKFIMNGGTINALYGVWASNYWRNSGENCGLCEVTIDDNCVLSSTSGVDIDVTEAPDTVLNIPSTVTVNYPAQP